MNKGGGRYDGPAQRLIEELGAEAVLLIVIGGTDGSGFTLKARDPVLLSRLPTVLRRVADDIEKGPSPVTLADPPGAPSTRAEETFRSADEVARRAWRRRGS